MDKATLSQMSREQLIEIAEKLKIKVHHKAKDETIIMKIMQQPVAYQAAAMSHPAEAPVAASLTNTPEQVMEAIRPYAEKEGFEAKFPGDGTWVFSYKGVSESGNLSIPLRVIKMKAESTARGKRGPALIKSPYDGSIIMSA